MPKLRASHIEEITLPSSTPDDPAVVKMETKLTAGQAMLVSDSDDKTDALAKLLSEVIQSWTFTDENGKEAAITPEAVLSLSIEDFTEIAKKLTKNIEVTVNKQHVAGDEKKG